MVRFLLNGHGFPVLEVHHAGYKWRVKSGPWSATHNRGLLHFFGGETGSRSATRRVSKIGQRSCNFYLYEDVIPTTSRPSNLFWF